MLLPLSLPPIIKTASFHKLNKYQLQGVGERLVFKSPSFFQRLTPLFQSKNWRNFHVSCVSRICRNALFQFYSYKLLFTLFFPRKAYQDSHRQLFWNTEKVNRQYLLFGHGRQVWMVEPNTVQLTMKDICDSYWLLQPLTNSQVDQVMNRGIFSAKTSLVNFFRWLIG